MLACRMLGKNKCAEQSSSAPVRRPQVLYCWCMTVQWHNIHVRRHCAACTTYCAACFRALFLPQCSANNICFSTCWTTAGPLPLVRSSAVAQRALSEGFVLYPQRIVALVCVLYRALPFANESQDEGFSHCQMGDNFQKKRCQNVQNHGKINLPRIFTTQDCWDRPLLRVLHILGIGRFYRDCGKSGRFQKCKKKLHLKPQVTLGLGTLNPNRRTPANPKDILTIFWIHGACSIRCNGYVTLRKF